MTSDKSTLREQAKYHRDRLLTREQDFEQVATHFFKSMDLSRDPIIAGYWPKGKEFDDRYILDDALKENISCTLPVIQPHTRILKFALWDAQTPLVKSSFGVMEPEQGENILPDIIIVPLLAFDRRGYRLGYGGGYYDATLAHLRAQKEILAVGVGYNEQAVLFNLPIDEHDQKLDRVITPQGVIDF